MKGIEDYVLATIAVIVTSILSGIGAAMAWFTGSKKLLHLRIDGVKADLDRVAQQKASHDVRLERVETCQENTSAALSELKSGQSKINEKLDEHYRDMMQALAGKMNPQ